MQVMIVPTYEDLSEEAASVLLRALEKRPDARVALPGGGTPLGMYEVILDLYKQSRVSFDKMLLFDVDTNWPYALDDPRSHYWFKKKYFTDPVNFDVSRWYYMDSAASHPETTCLEYEQLIADLGGLDLIIDGLGNNGHLGYNEPGTPWDTRTRLEILHPSTIAANSRWVASIEEAPTKGITLGMATMLEAREIVILVSGEGKAGIVQRVVEGPASVDVPMTALRNHPSTTLILDQAAASNLRR